MGGDWSWSGQTVLGFISLLFVCQRRDILHYANDFLWRKSFIAFSISVLDGVTGSKKLVIILQKYSALHCYQNILELRQAERKYCIEILNG